MLGEWGYEWKMEACLEVGPEVGLGVGCQIFFGPLFSMGFAS